MKNLLYERQREFQGKGKIVPFLSSLASNLDRRQEGALICQGWNVVLF